MRKHVRYLSYVVRHKWFVFVAGLRTGAPLWRLLIHDWSKFLPSEWFAYATFFYAPKPQRTWHPEMSPRQIDEWPEREAERRQAAFDAAWLHHQHANPHHWQHWILREDSGSIKTLEMPDHFVREMVADWMGAGRAITGRWEAIDWYAKNREKMQLHWATRAQVETLLSTCAAQPQLAAVD